MVPNDPTNGRAAGSPAHAATEATAAPAARLQNLWIEGASPDLDSFLAQSGDLSPLQLVAVLRVDQRERWRLGQHVPAETYLQRYPSVYDDDDGAADLVYGEYLLREQRGAAPSAEEFLWRFPDLAVILRPQIDLHRALQTVSAHACSVPDQTLPGEVVTPERAPPGEARGPFVSGYEILGELGRGGMGVVYRARHLRLKRLVALKMLLAGAHAGADERGRFLTEAESAARLRHPNIVQVYELGESEGRPYLALELIEGGSLKGSQAGTPQPGRWSAELLQKLALAVQYAHDQGVVHRDLKPANILLQRDEGRAVRDEAKAGTAINSQPFHSIPKITDFGLAKRVGALASAGDGTRTGDILGTPSYMAPEQAAGKIAEIGPATDVYALGSILHELITGRPPFLADSPLSALQQVMTEDPVSPSQLQRRTPRDLVTVCMKCLQKEPRRRYPTAAALAEDLRRFLADEPILARPVGGAERLWRLGRRNPILAGLVSLVTVLVGVIAVGAFLSALSLREAVDQAQDNARERYWEGKLADARAFRFSDRIGRRFKGLDALLEAMRIRSAPELRDEMIAGLALFDLSQTKAWALPAGLNPLIVFAGDHQRYACAEERSGVISVRRTKDHQEQYRVRGPTSPGHLLFSQDGRFLAVSWPPRTVEVWKLVDNEPALAARITNGAIGQNNTIAIDFSPDGNSLAAGQTDRTIQFHDLAAGRPGNKIHIGCVPNYLAFHPKERQLAIACESGIQIRDIDTGKLLVALEHDKEVTWGAWHPGGKHLAAVSNDQIVLWDAVQRRQIGTRFGPAAGGILVSFSRKGDFLIRCDWDQKLRVLETWTGKELFQSDLPGGTVIGISPDHHEMAVEIVDGQTRMLELARSPAYRTFAPTPNKSGESCNQPAVATSGRARGRLLALGSSEGVYLFDLATETETGRLSIGDTRSVVFDSTGSLWTNGISGVWRWPVTDSSAEGNGVTIGPPERFLTSTSDMQIACSTDGSVVAVAMGDLGGVVLRREQPGKWVALQPHPDVRHIAVSPNGQWVATGTHNGQGVKVWDAQSGRLIKELPLGWATVTFSPDGKWLLTASGEYRLWHCDSWEPGPSLGMASRSNPSFPCYSGDGCTLLLDVGGGLLRLLDTATGRVLGQLQSPFGTMGSFMTYSSDGGVIVTHDLRCIHVWDLNAISREFAAVGLNWEVPTAEGLSPAATPLRMRVINADVRQEALHRLQKCDRYLTQHPGATQGYWDRGRAFLALERFEEAVGDFTRAIELNPETRFFVARADCHGQLGKHADESADLYAALRTAPANDPETAVICNKLARLLLTGPSELRDPDKAASFASRAVRLASEEMHYLNTLGTAYYRLERFDEAIGVLRRSLRSAASPPHDLLVLALCCHKLGDTALAQDYFDQALYWLKCHADELRPTVRGELEAFKMEALALGLR
jgi:WD40 repeat protein